jgi:2-hydroxy-3-keto-5-methylthiopentenyl-1-phosphate phosphatase
MNLNNKSYKFFIDFDGTISNPDIGEALFLRFGDSDSVQYSINEWIGKKINSVRLWELLCASVGQFDENNFERFLDEMEMDPGFLEFIEFCNRENFQIRILSDGFDYYIKRFLARRGVERLEVYSNSLIIDNRNKLIPSFPFRDEDCDCCANCKRNHILNFSGDDDYTFYIGDGLTDTCPAQFCDYIFAKDSLLRFCEISRITYFPYKTFNDIIGKIELIKEKKRLRKRHQADLKRKEVFLQG